ncbi:MAG: type II secretion system GspH family protein [Planctomycetales bacterium]|nr:type II secretion system GspH family protein [Planctomycetales bacterium]
MNRKNKSGFTLLETLFAAMLIGLVIAALVASSGAFTMANGYGVDLSTAEFLGEQIRELTARPEVIFDNDPDTQDTLLLLNNVTYSPPRDTGGAVLTGFSAFAQKVAVNYVQPGNLAQVSGSRTDFVRVTVTITKNNMPVSSTSWIRARRLTVDN